MQVRFRWRGADVPSEEWELRLRLIFRGEDLGDHRGAPHFSRHSCTTFDDGGVAGVYVIPPLPLTRSSAVGSCAASRFLGGRLLPPPCPHHGCDGWGPPCMSPMGV